MGYKKRPDFQAQQVEYLTKLEQNIKKNNWAPMDCVVECRDCKTQTDITSAQEGIDFIEQHKGHYTWTTNRNVKR